MEDAVHWLVGQLCTATQLHTPIMGLQCLHVSLHHPITTDNWRCELLIVRLPTILNIISEPNVSIVFWYMMFPVVLTVYSIDGGCSPLTSWSAVYGYSIAHTYHGSAMSTCLPTPPHNNWQLTVRVTNCLLPNTIRNQSEVWMVTQLERG